MKQTVYVAYHKECPIVQDDVYVPIQVGAAISDVKLDMIGDDSGENISSRNPNYCELTALYWMWKNDKTSDIVGLFHYRRFLYPRLSKWKRFLYRRVAMRDILLEKPSAEQANELVGNPGFDKILEKYDIITTNLVANQGRTLLKHYADAHRISDMEVARAVLVEFYPDYVDAFDKQMGGLKFNYANMFVASKKVADEYCEWLFDVLAKIEQRVTIPTDPVQSRIFGYISERLFGVYIKRNNLKVKQLYVCNIDI